MIYITGDTHGDFRRFTTDCFPEQKEMTKDDFVIIVGDFGGVWSNKDTKKEDYWLDWLNDKPFTTLFLDGNHENFDRLNSMPVTSWCGGNIHKVRDSIFHLMRGQVFTLCSEDMEHTFFTFGGASSHDIRDGILEPDDQRIKAWLKDYTKMFRINHISWWVNELPSETEMQIGFENLDKHDFKVDYILTHSPYTSLLKQMDGGSGLYQSDILTDYLQHIKCKTEFKQWIFGHMHINQMFHWERTVCIYEQISRLL